MRRLLHVGTTVLALSIPAHATAQVRVAPHIGTLGVGADVGTSFGGPIGIRAGANVAPWKIDQTESGIDYEISFPSPQFTTMLDLNTPVGFRVSGGLLISPNDISGRADFAASVEINGVTYTSSQVNTLEAAIVTKTVAPYLGIGWGNTGSKRVGFFMDVGAAFHGSPTVDYTVTGPLANDPTLITNLNAEARDLESELDAFTFYPVITLGISFTLGAPVP